MPVLSANSIARCLKKEAIDSIVLRGHIKRTDKWHSEFCLQTWIEWHPNGSELTFLCGKSKYVAHNNFVGIRGPIESDPILRAYSYEQFVEAINLWPHVWQVENPILISEEREGATTQTCPVGTSISAYIAYTAFAERLRLALATVKGSSSYDGYRILTERFTAFLAQSRQDIRPVVDIL